MNIPRYTYQMEVSTIRKHASINILVHHPKTEEGKLELAQRVADVHATAVSQRLRSLSYPTSQKQDLLNAIIKTIKEGSSEET